MKNLSVAFLYNVRHLYPDANDPRTQVETDFDDPGTIRWIVKHLKRVAPSVLAIEANDEAIGKLYKNRNKIDLAFNFAEGRFGEDREAHIPAVLEMLRIPYLGCTPLASALLLNKAKTKEVVAAHDIPTAPFIITVNPEEKLPAELKFPLMVKPLSQGSSAGITNKSLVRSKKDLARQIEFVVKTFNQPALIEKFLPGREFSIAMMGNPPVMLPAIEAQHHLLPKEYAPLDSLEVKWFFEEQNTHHHLACPAIISRPLYKKLEKICFGSWEALGIRDWCRLDIRCDEAGEPHLIEVNSPCGLLPPEISMTSYFPLAARAAGIGYEPLLKKLINLALKRYAGRTPKSCQLIESAPAV